MRKKHSLFAKLSLAIAATAGTFVLLEIAIRCLGIAPELRTINITDSESPYQYSTNPILGYEHKHNFHYTNSGNTAQAHYTNSHGQRDVHRTLEKGTGVQRIILLGDSVVECIEIGDIDKTISRQLEILFPLGKTEVLNFGVNGYCTLAEVELLRTKGLKFDPDLVIVLFVWNDYYNFNESAISKSVYMEHLADQARYDRRIQLGDFLMRSSHVFRVTCYRDPIRHGELESNFGLENNVAKGLRMLRRLSTEWDFKVLIAIWPSFHDNGVVDLQLNPQQTALPEIPPTQELMIERLAHRYGLPTVRLSKLFQQHWNSLDVQGTPKTYYTIGDTMHLQEAGSRAAAQILKSVLDEFSADGDRQSEDAVNSAGA